MVYLSKLTPFQTIQLYRVSVDNSHMEISLGDQSYVGYLFKTPLKVGDASGIAEPLYVVCAPVAA